MTCPDEIASILLQIVHDAIGNIRQGGTLRNPEQCFLEADHVHNLPRLIMDYDSNKLKYYYDVERVSYLKWSDPQYELAPIEWTDR